MNNEFNFESNASVFGGSDSTKKRDKFAIASLALGIASILACCCLCASVLGIILMGISAVLAIVFAFLSKKNAGGKMDKLAVIGLILGIVSIVVLICFAIALVGTYALIDQMPEDEMLTYLEENYKPLMEGNEQAYNELVEAVKTIYATRNAK